MEYARIVDGKAQLGLPKTGVLSGGVTVSNYHLLPESVLANEGWLPRVDVKPDYNAETHMLRQGTPYEENGQIIVPYEAVDIPPDELDTMMDELEALL